MSIRQDRTVLFVPGALTGGWIWERDFVPYFEAAGYAARTVTFPSHEASGWRRHRLGLRSAVEHLGNTIDRLPRSPTLIAHSLGGLVTMQLLRERTVAAAILFSPVPTDGAWRSLLSLARRSPASVAKFVAVSIDPRVTRLGRPPLGIYSESCDIEITQTINSQLRGESLRALGEALWRRDIARPSATPLHFFGAEGDFLIPAVEVRRMAQRHGAPVTIYPGMSHTVQAERQWRRVADDMLAWLASLDRVGGDLPSASGLTADLR